MRASASSSYKPGMRRLHNGAHGGMLAVGFRSCVRVLRLNHRPCLCPCHPTRVEGWSRTLRSKLVGKPDPLIRAWPWGTVPGVSAAAPGDNFQGQPRLICINWRGPFSVCVCAWVTMLCIQTTWIHHKSTELHGLAEVQASSVSWQIFIDFSSEDPCYYHTVSLNTICTAIHFWTASFVVLIPIDFLLNSHWIMHMTQYTALV